MNSMTWKIFFEILSLFESLTMFYNKNQFKSSSSKFFFALFSLSEKSFALKLWIFSKIWSFSRSEMFFTKFDDNENVEKLIKTKWTIVDAKSWVVESRRKKNRIIEYVWMMWKRDEKSCTKKKKKRMRDLNRNVNCVEK